MFGKIGGLFGKKKPKPFEPTVPTGDNDKVWYANVDPRASFNMELANVRVKKIGEEEPVPVFLGSPDYLAPISNLKSDKDVQVTVWNEEEVEEVSSGVRDMVSEVGLSDTEEEDDGEEDEDANPSEGYFFSGEYDEEKVGYLFSGEYDEDEDPEEDEEPFGHVVMGLKGEIMGDLDIGSDSEVIPPFTDLVIVSSDEESIEPQPVEPLVKNISEEVRKVLDRRELAFKSVERALSRISKLKDGDSTFKLRLSMLSLTLKEYEDTRRSLLEDPDEVEVDFLHSEVIEEAYAWVERGINRVA